MKDFRMSKLCIKKGFIYFSLLFFWPIYGLEELCGNSQIFAVGRITLCFIFLFLYLYRRKLSFLDVVIILFNIWLNISTIIRKGNIIGAAYGNLLLVVSVCFFFEYFLKADKDTFLVCLYNYCFATVLLNCVSVFLFPGGLYVDSRGTMDTNFLLGNYNAFIIHIFPAIVVGYYLVNKKKISVWQHVMLWLIVVVTYCMERSVASIIGIMCIAIFELLMNKRIAQVCYHPIIFVISTIFFAIYIIFARGGPLFNSIIKWAGKSSTLSGRTLLWDKIIAILPQTGLLGTGVQTEMVLIERLNINYAGHAHNIILQVLFQSGIIGISIWLVLILIILSSLVKFSRNRFSRNYGCAFAVLLLMLSVDFYGYMMILPMFVLINYCCVEASSLQNRA